MSGMLLAAVGGPDVFTPQKDPGAEKILGSSATARREFSQSETLAWLTEIYDNTPAGQPKRIDVSARLISESGQEAFVSRDRAAWQQAMDRVTASAKDGTNLVPAVLAAVEAKATLGEVADALRDVFGEYSERAI